MLRSLRARLMVGMIASTALLLAGFGVAVYCAVGGALLSQLDSSLGVAARTMAASMELDDGEIEVEYDPNRMPEMSQGTSRVYFRLWSADGAVLGDWSPGAKQDLPNFAGPDGEPEFRNIRLTGGTDARAIGIRFRVRHEEETDEHDDGPRAASAIMTVEAEPEVILVAAHDTVAMDAQLAELGWLLLACGATTMAAAVGISWAIVRRGLRPATVLAQRIARISADDLAAAVPPGSLPAEMVPIVERLNDLLRRLAEAFQRERSFTADAAHELRTPLAGMRSTIEVALACGGNDEHYRDSLVDCLDIARKMQAMVEGLLTLARLESSPPSAEREPVGLAELVDDCWRAFAERAGQRKLTLDNRIPQHLACLADRDNIAMALANLLDNAVEYADESGRIEVAARAENGTVELALSNTGCRLTPQQVSQVFDRLWRADPSRTDTGLHCGLGLALVRNIAGSLGGKAVAELREGGVFTVLLELPSA